MAATGAAMTGLERVGKTLPLVPHQTRLVALPVALLFGFALVVEFLALGDAELDLGDALGVEIEAQRNERHALALDRGGELVGLVLVDEQLALAARLMIETARHRIFGDVGVDEEQLAILRIGVG